MEVRSLDDEADKFLEKQLTGAQMGKYVIFQLDFYRAWKTPSSRSASAAADGASADQKIA